MVLKFSTDEEDHDRLEQARRNVWGDEFWRKSGRKVLKPLELPRIQVPEAPKPPTPPAEPTNEPEIEPSVEPKSSRKRRPSERAAAAAADAAAAAAKRAKQAPIQLSAMAMSRLAMFSGDPTPAVRPAAPAPAPVPAPVPAQPAPGPVVTRCRSGALPARPLSPPAPLASAVRVVSRWGSVYWLAKGSPPRAAPTPPQQPAAAPTAPQTRPPRPPAAAPAAPPPRPPRPPRPPQPRAVAPPAPAPKRRPPQPRPVAPSAFQRPSAQPPTALARATVAAPPSAAPPRAPATLDPKSLVGKKVLKDFLDPVTGQIRPFEGTVAKWQPRLGWALVRYDDGDREEIDLAEAEACVKRWEEVKGAAGAGQQGQQRKKKALKPGRRPKAHATRPKKRG